MIVFLKSHPVTQAMSGAAKPADLGEGEVRRNPGEPSAAQAGEGAYKKPRIEWQGLTLAIENPAGSVRRGVNRSGEAWEIRMSYDYGEVVGSMGVDGDPVDIYMGPNPDAPMVYVVHQNTYGDWTRYDEDKAMAGFDSEEDAKQAFLANYTDPRFLGPITAMPVAEFVSKVRATIDKPAMIKALLLKAHVDTYTRSDGTVVQAHEDKRQRHQQYAEMFKPSLGIRRDDMPQVPSGVKEKFLNGLRESGVSVTEATVNPSELKPTQGTYNAANMDYLTDETRAGRYDAKTRILVSSDNRVLDGHHRWAVAALEGKQLPIIKIGMPAMELIKVAKKFNDDNGVESRGTAGGATIAKSMVLFFKSHVGPYLRGGRLVNVAGYQGRSARPHATPGQMSLFGGPMSGKPMGPSPLNGKDAVTHTPDMFADELQHTEPAGEHEHDHLLSDFPEGTTWSRGKGLIAGHYAVELPGKDILSAYHAKPEDAAAQGKQWLSNRESSAKNKADRATALAAMRDRLMAGGEVTDMDLNRLGLKAGSSGLKWFIPAAAEVFGITSHAVRPHIKSLIRVGHTDMGTKLEFVDPRKALQAVAAGLAPKPAALQHPTETAKFKTWFRGSKVVDGNGKPLIVYHGTADDFAEFKHGHANKKDNGWLGQGFYFTNDTEISNSYTNLKAGASPNVMPVYLSLKNPYQATLEDKQRLMLAERRGDNEAAAKWTQELAAKGHDGVILSYGHIQNGDYPAEYVVFDPTQIKSAIGNNGEFDGSNPDITKSMPVVFLAPR